MKEAFSVVDPPLGVHAIFAALGAGAVAVSGLVITGDAAALAAFG